MSKDIGLDYLLDLHGEIIVQDKGCWVKIEARKLIKPTKERPRGIKYSLTLHDRDGKRLLGIDNAHPIKTRKRGRFIARKIVYDHMHKNSNNEAEPYIFESAGQLVADFFAEVDKVLDEI